MINSICSSLFPCLYKSKAELKAKLTVSLEIVDNSLTELPTESSYPLKDFSSGNEEDDSLDDEFGYSSRKIVFKSNQKNESEKKLKFIFVSYQFNLFRQKKI